jgi:hypothetical protein
MCGVVFKFGISLFGHSDLYSSRIRLSRIHCCPRLQVSCRILLERLPGFETIRARYDPPAEQRRDFGTLGYYERCACGGSKERRVYPTTEMEGWCFCRAITPSIITSVYPADNRWHDRTTHACLGWLADTAMCGGLI